MSRYYNEREGSRDFGPTEREIKEIIRMAEAEEDFEDQVSNGFIDMHLYKKCENPGELIIYKTNEEFSIIHKDEGRVMVCNISDEFKIISDTNDNREDLILKFSDLTILRVRFISPEDYFTRGYTILIQKSVENSIARKVLEYRVKNESKTEIFISINEFEEKIKELKQKNIEYKEKWEFSDNKRFEMMPTFGNLGWNRKYAFVSDTLWMYFNMLNEHEPSFHDLIAWIDHFDLIFKYSDINIRDSTIIQSLNTIHWYIYEEIDYRLRGEEDYHLRLDE